MKSIIQHRIQIERQFKQIKQFMLFLFENMTFINKS